jgi:nicotinamidase/pyrazinamidase
MRKNALLIIDVQNDFCHGGALAVPEGDSIIPVINRYIEIFTAEGSPIFASRDWHPVRTRHFKEFGGAWPPHCVQGSFGALFRSDLELPKNTVIITAGDDPDKEGYSAFEGHGATGKTFDGLLKDAGVERLYVGGLATDYCVKETVLDAIKHGFSVTVLTDAVKGVEVNAGDSKRALEDMASAGAEEVTLENIRIRV